MNKSRTLVISRSNTMEMVVVQTPVKGVKNRKGEQAVHSVTKHRKIKGGR